METKSQFYPSQIILILNSYNKNKYSDLCPIGHAYKFGEEK